MGCCPSRLGPEDPGRREFLSASSAAVLTGLLASACGGATGPNTSFSGTVVITVADYPALAAVGGVALLQGTPVPMAAVRTGATDFLVLSRICPHQGSTINLNGNGFRCPNHGALFDTQGNNVGGQPTRALNRYSASYDVATDKLTISA